MRTAVTVVFFGLSVGVPIAACGGKLTDADGDGGSSTSHVDGSSTHPTPNPNPNPNPTPTPPPTPTPTPPPPNPTGCAPSSVMGFNPHWVAPTGAHQGLCTTAQIAAFYNDCLSSTATQQSCAHFQPNGNAADEKCEACIVTQDTASTYGPLVVSAGTLALNIAGCIALTDSSAVQCAHDEQANDQCIAKACAPNCPITDDASFQLYEACVQQADGTVCSAFATKASCTNSLGDGGSAICLTGQSFEDSYTTLATLFCAP